MTDDPPPPPPPPEDADVMPPPPAPPQDDEFVPPPPCDVSAPPPPGTPPPADMPAPAEEAPPLPTRETVQDAPPALPQRDQPKPNSPPNLPELDQPLSKSQSSQDLPPALPMRDQLVPKSQSSQDLPPALPVRDTHRRKGALAMPSPLSKPPTEVAPQPRSNDSPPPPPPPEEPGNPEPPPPPPPPADGDAPPPPPTTPEATSATATTWTDAASTAPRQAIARRPKKHQAHARLSTGSTGDDSDDLPPPPPPDIDLSGSLTSLPPTTVALTPEAPAVKRGVAVKPRKQQQQAPPKKAPAKGKKKVKPFVPTVPYTEEDNRAAVVIQKFVRGWLVRSHLEGERWILAGNSDNILAKDSHPTVSRARASYRRPPTRGHIKSVKSLPQSIPDRDPTDEVAAAALRAKYRDPSRPMSVVSGTDLGSALKNLKKSGSTPTVEKKATPAASAEPAEPKQTSIIGKLLDVLLRRRSNPQELVDKKILRPEDNPLRGLPGKGTGMKSPKGRRGEEEAGTPKSRRDKAKEEKEAKKREKEEKKAKEREEKEKAKEEKERAKREKAEAKK